VHGLAFGRPDFKGLEVHDGQKASVWRLERTPKGYEEGMLKTNREVWRNSEVADEARSIPKSHMKLAGVFQSNGGGSLRIRNEIYRKILDDHWVKEQLPSVNWKSIAQAALIGIFLLSITLGSYAWEQRGHAIQRTDGLDKDDRDFSWSLLRKNYQAEKRRLSGHGGSVLSVAWSGDGKTLASGSNDGTIKLWDVAGGKELRTLRGQGHYPLSVAWSKDGKTLASSGAEKTIKLWNVVTGKELRTLSGHLGSVRSVAWSVDGKTLASGGSDKTIKLWYIAGGK
jgi:WD40 repeat protein